jgi:hypothetical protein
VVGSHVSLGYAWAVQIMRVELWSRLIQNQLT